MTKLDDALHVAGPIELDADGHRVQRCLRCDRILASPDGEIRGHALRDAAAGETVEIETVLYVEVPAGTVVSAILDCPGGLP